MGDGESSLMCEAVKVIIPFVHSTSLHPKSPEHRETVSLEASVPCASSPDRGARHYSESLHFFISKVDARMVRKFSRGIDEEVCVKPRTVAGTAARLQRALVSVCVVCSLHAEVRHQSKFKLRPF